MADRIKCFTEVKSIAKTMMEGVKDTDVDHFINKVLDTAEKIKDLADKKAANGENYKKVVKDELANYLKAHKLEMSRHLMEKKMDMAKQVKLLARFEDFGGTPKEAIEMLESSFVGGVSAKEGEAASISQKALVLKTRYINLIEQLKHKKLYDTLASGEKDLNIAKEIKELATKDGTPGVTKDVDALEIAKVVHRFNQVLLLDKQDAGILVRNMPGYIAKQTHDKMRIGIVAANDWAKEVLPMLSEKTFKPGMDMDAKLSYLESVHEEITTNKGKQDASGTEAFLTASRRKQAVAHGMSSERALHFRDAEAWHNYNQKYGSRTIYESIFRSITDDTRRIAMVDKFGTDPAALYSSLRAKIDSKFEAEVLAASKELAANKVPEQTKILEKNLKKAQDDRKVFLQSQKFLEVRMKEVSGATSVGADNLINNTTNAILAWNSTRTLGAATPALITDIGFAPWNIATSTGKNFLNSMVKNITEYAAVFNGQARRDFLAAYDIHSESTAMAIHNDISGDAVKPGMISKGMEMFFKSIGLSQVSETSRFAVTKTLATIITNARHLEFSNISSQLGNTFKRFDITEDVWNIIRQGVVHMDVRGEKLELISPSGIRTLEAPQGVDPRVWRRQTEDAAQKLSMYLNEMANYTSMTATARNRAFTLQGTEQGTGINAILRLASQLKTPALQSFNAVRLGIRNNASVPHSSAFRAMGDMNNVKVMAQFVPVMVGLGYASMSAKAFLRGETPPDIKKQRVFEDALIRSGMLGLYGDALLGEYDRTGRNLSVDMSLGPTGQMVAEVGKVFSKMREGQKFERDAFNLMLRSIPGNNHLIFRPLFDWAIGNSIQEEYSTGYERRRSRRLEEERGSQLLW